ncbi:MAG: 30S ribosomal protein S8 [Candidatus Nomurabacteria bacterium GW2011_GWF2_35_66]|uniref:Small ribosomal subunit protein uS8 n=1 Tax=Candidatus Nomurabacteria bacterium GW2011_GWE1_35_16 TaxID=1618761 RepID=A0A0G0EEX3_9BACT|nr:MAG: 30S ribosomal protein S8 [Candidatus Nomurabacteria bacterium GW2011_GWF1_34_20]KKP61624.1 MAG: 30S ribosomal protein S8 [Candidatus Nomurabacteria bacterium GW2011_GWE2_34_25]KKP65917.1 MAG: 30S ribosomal protein S8 [Candidatus Nomurabacteria bacterium GW2011_GWE1_35_16]KKP82973.1 MAG: 30S ribosomal protein S8 [Candidatus Nomurabacteria bacterium GW2011_GWF2_35_66]HAE36287.1 30S ribosomal protein S8 [Candidatus Nomurabacteria bacterium]
MDQIANMVNMVKNGGRASHEFVAVPFSKVKQAIAECLVKEGYLTSATKKTKKGFPILELGIAYVDGAPKVSEVERVSKSSRRVYKGMKDIRYTKGGNLITVFSTPKGIMTDKQARKEMVGGEVLFKMW